MFGSEIKTRVMEAVRQRIESGEVAYNKRCEELEHQMEFAKLAAADEIVKSILGPLSK
jgi:hypothetical protein